ncbi:hypothetical protein L3Y34_009239 [Caenorhabditis briggsae]|uniref:Uncharacterized protein n=2 Tax=Caenorhabditis briggsae TaxID=6238 RepID=A0AAE9A807_CAEBR|nr:hypothetical protein L3Y34_009239 [Caenorhabditis briggsae]
MGNIDYFGGVEHITDDHLDEFHRISGDFKRCLMATRFGEACEVFNGMIQYTTHLNVEPDEAEEDAEFFINFAESIGPHCRKQLYIAMAKILNPTAKVLIQRRLRHMNTKFFSMDALLPTPRQLSSGTVLMEVYPKEDLPSAMAFGSNSNGKLGIGSPRYAQKMVNIKLPEQIMDAKIGEEHSIFFTNSGNYYGSGKSANYKNQTGTELEWTPTKLNCIKHDWETAQNNPPKFFITGRKTVFQNVGGPSTSYGSLKCLEMEGSDDGAVQFKLIDVPKNEIFTLDGHKYLREDPWHPSKSITVTIKDLFGHYSQIEVYEDMLCAYFHGNRIDIEWFICGVPINKDHLKNKVNFGTKGALWVHDQEMVYRGRLGFEYSVIDGVGKLVGRLAEFPYHQAIRGITASADGESVIFLPRPEFPSHLYGPREAAHQTLPNFATTGQVLERLHVNWAATNEDVIKQFHYYAKDHWPGKLYAWTGYPSHFGVFLLPMFRRIQHFVTIEGHYMNGFNEIMALPEKEYGTLPKEELEMWNERWIYPSAGWSEEEREDRLEEIKREEVTILEEVRASLNAAEARIRNHKSSAGRMMFLFTERLVYLLKACIEYTDRVTLEPIIKITEYVTIVDTVKNEIQDRMAEGDIKPNDPRYALIRVETIQDGSNQYHCYITYTTYYHLIVLDLTSYIEDGIVHLYKVNDKEGRERYNQLVEYFFETSTEGIFKQKVTALFHLPHTRYYIDYYEVVTFDDSIFKVPKFLFEIHSVGFNAKRERDAIKEGQDPNEFELDLTDFELEYLMQGLMSPRRLLFADKDVLYNMFLVCDEWNFRILLPVLVEQLVKEIEESDSYILYNLFIRQTSLTIEMVARYQPNLIFTWDELPLPTNYLRVMNRLTQKIWRYHFKPVPLQDLPLPIRPDPKKKKIRRTGMSAFKKITSTTGFSDKIVWDHNVLNEYINEIGRNNAPDFIRQQIDAYRKRRRSSQ